MPKSFEEFSNYLDINTVHRIFNTLMGWSKQQTLDWASEVPESFWESIHIKRGHLIDMVVENIVREFMSRQQYEFSTYDELFETTNKLTAAVMVVMSLRNVTDDSYKFMKKSVEETLENLLHQRK